MYVYIYVCRYVRMYISMGMKLETKHNEQSESTTAARYKTPLIYIR